MGYCLRLCHLKWITGHTFTCQRLTWPAILLKLSCLTGRIRLPTDQQLDSFLRSNHEWLFIEGWPFAHQDAAQLTAEFHQHYHQEDDLDREMQDMFPELYDYDPVEAE